MFASSAINFVHLSFGNFPAGEDSSCLPPQPTTSLAIRANVTKDLTTCGYWGLRVTGGTPPYSISLAAVGSPVVTNVSLAEGLDVMTYIDRADPNGLMLGGCLLYRTDAILMVRYLGTTAAVIDS